MTFSQFPSTFSIALFLILRFALFPRPDSQGKLIVTKYSGANSFHAEFTRRMAELGLGAGS